MRALRADEAAAERVVLVAPHTKNPVAPDLDGKATGRLAERAGSVLGSGRGGIRGHVGQLLGPASVRRSETRRNETEVLADAGPFDSDRAPTRAIRASPPRRFVLNPTPPRPRSRLARPIPNAAKCLPRTHFLRTPAIVRTSLELDPRNPSALEGGGTMSRSAARPRC